MAARVTDRSQHLQLAFGLDPFGNGRKAERLTKPHDRVDDLAALGVARHRADETCIELQGVEGQHLKMTEAGVAGAEIVKREVGAERLQLRKRPPRQLQIFDDGAFGHLKGQSAERKSEFLRSDLVQPPSEQRVTELQRRYVHRKPDLSGPPRGRGTRLAQKPLG